MAAQALELTTEEIQQIRELAVEAHGTQAPRYPPASVALLLADTPPLE